MQNDIIHPNFTTHKEIPSKETTEQPTAAQGEGLTPFLMPSASWALLCKDVRKGIQSGRATGQKVKDQYSDVR